MAFDPMSFWLKGSLFWARALRQQQQAYLKMLCGMAKSMPRNSAADMAAEAESLRSRTPKPVPLHRRSPVALPATEPAAKEIEQATA